MRAGGGPRVVAIPWLLREAGGLLAARGLASELGSLGAALLETEEAELSLRFWGVRADAERLSRVGDFLKLRVLVRRLWNDDRASAKMVIRGTSKGW